MSLPPSRYKPAERQQTVLMAMIFCASLIMASSAQETLPYEGRLKGIGCVAAAVEIGPGMFVACSSQDNILRIYRTSDSMAPVSTFDASEFLGVKGRSVDLSGAARIGDRIYWIGSHSRDDAGLLHADRHCLFATDIEHKKESVRIRPVGKSRLNLLHKLPGLRTVSTLRLDKALGLVDGVAKLQSVSLAPSRKGLRIEALASDPRLGILFIGFRNPRPIRVMTGRPHALVIPLNNPADVTEKGAEPIFGEAMLWDFDGLGITGFKFSPTHDAYFVLAQSHDKNDTAVLYKWSGMKAYSPKRVRHLDSIGADSCMVALGPGANIRRLSLLISGCGQSHHDNKTGIWRLETITVSPQ